MKEMFREEEIYKAVKLRLLEIEPDGTIWKVAEMRGNRWNNIPTLLRIMRRRAEHDQGQYFQVRRMTNGKRIYCLAHRLVWLHFKGPIPAGAQINHKNGKKKDNHPDNLEIVTASENLIHAHQTGLVNQYGERNPAAKLTDGQIEAIRRIYAAGGVTLANLADQFMMSSQGISRIVRGERRVRQLGKTADYTSRRQRPTQTRSAKGQFLG